MPKFGRGTKCIKSLLSEASKNMQNPRFRCFPSILHKNKHRKITLSRLKLLSPHDFLDVIQFVQRLHGRQVVDVERQYLVANLTKNWVIELEE